MRTKMTTRALGVLVALVVLSTAGRLEAQAQRVDYLVRMLQTSDQFRVRAQAAISLGRVEASEPIVSALSTALGDDHPAVRTAAAASLERLADPGALTALRGVARDRDPGVRRAVASAIRVLERVARTAPRRDAGGTTVPGQDALYYVGVGQPGARDSSVDPATLRRAKELLSRLVSEVEGVEVAPDNESNAAATRVLQRRRLTGYYIDSSVVSVSSEGGNTRVVVSVILNTYPGRDMRAILQGSATVPGSTGPAARDQALEGAFRGAVRRLPQAMASSRR